MSKGSIWKKSQRRGGLAPVAEIFAAALQEDPAVEAERERQLAYLQQRAGKRLLQADLARGWSAWLDAFLERRRKQRLLR